MKNFNHITIIIWICFLISNLQSCSASKFAYATIHYEGTPRDEEYILGIRTLIKSIRLTDKENDIIVLATDSVSQKTGAIFTADGAKIIPIPPISNPYKDNPERRKYYTTRFEMTLIKLHLWNQTAYERLIYMDADCIVLHNIQELFHCGHFCAAYMNVIAFHTAVMVIKPDTVTYIDMVNKLSTLESYDGADQGFLVSYFDQMNNAPYFDSTTQSEAPMNRLHIGYSMNHIYFYEKGTWDNGWRQGQFKNLDIPAYVLTYPITPSLKPFYWWSYLWLNVHWVWNHYRIQIEESWTPILFMLTLTIAAFIFAAEFFVRNRKRQSESTRFIEVGKTTWIIALVGMLATNYMVFTLIPTIMPPSLAIPFFFLSQNVIFFIIASKVVQLYYVPISLTAVLQSIIMCGCLDFVLVQMAGTNYSNAVFKIWMILITLVLYIVLQLCILVLWMLQKKAPISLLPTRL